MHWDLVTDVAGQAAKAWWLGAIALVLLATIAPRVARAQGTAVLTIVDGDARVIEGARALAATVGMRLGAGTLIDTAADLSLLRLEWSDGRVLDLGPATRVMLWPPGLAGPQRPGPMFYLLGGWAKHSLGTDGEGQAMPALELTASSGVVVSYVGADRTLVFVESGQTEVVGRAARDALALHQGESCTVVGNERPLASPRAPPGLLAQMPRSFRDTIPRRLALLGSRGIDGRVLPAPSYAELAPWLTAEPALRRDFPRRFAALARDPAFRDALAAHLAAHPEWESVLAPARALRPPAAAASR